DRKNSVQNCIIQGVFSCWVLLIGWMGLFICHNWLFMVIKIDLWTAKKASCENEHLVPLPALFESHDLSGDMKITAQELALATGMDELETLNVAFPLCDTNGDGFLSREEFVNSPLQWRTLGTPKWNTAVEAQKVNST
ncbi:unnamed protein product, partial [Owenia fusiformis]